MKERQFGAVRRPLAAVVALLAVAAVLLLPGRAQAAQSLKVATYNVCGQSGCQSGLAPTVWADTLAGAVTGYGADVVDLQEVCAGQADLLRARLTGYTVHYLKAVTLTSGQTGCAKWGGDAASFGAAMLVRADAGAVFQDLVLQPVAPNVERRPLICANLAAPGGTPVQSCTAHLDSGPGGLRAAGLPTVVDRMRGWGQGRPAVLAGDFNADPADPNLGVLYLAQDGTGAMSEAEERDRAAFAPACKGLRLCRSGKPTAGTRKIDYLFSDPAGFGPAQGAETVQVTGPDGKPLSDHLMYRAALPLAPDTLPPAAPLVFNGPTVIGSGNDWANAVDRVAGDFTGDGTDDLVMRFANGSVQLYPGNGNGSFGSARQLATGWTGPLGLTAGYFHDGVHADLLVRRDDGSAAVYEGDGAGGLGTPHPLTVPGGLQNAQDLAVGHVLGAASNDLVARWGDQHFSARPVLRDANGQYTVGDAVSVLPGGAAKLPDTADLVVGDFDGDGRTDLLLRRTDGAAVLYPAAGDNSFPAGTPVTDGRDWTKYPGQNWLGAERLTAGDFDHDGRADLLLTWMYDHVTGSPVAIGQSEFLRSTGTAPALFGAPLVQKWSDAGYWATASDVLAANFDGAGTADLLARRPRFLKAKAGTGTGTFGGDQTIAGSWDWASALTAADFDGDGAPDLLARDAAGARLYRGTPGALGTYQAYSQVAPAGLDWSQVVEATAGRFSDPSRADLVVRLADGRLFRFPWTGTAFGPGTQVAAGGSPVAWSDAASVTGGDFDGDGRDDLLVRWTAGSAFLYAGDGAGGFAGSRPVRPAGALSDLADLAQAQVYTGKPPVNLYRFADGTLLADRSHGTDLTSPDPALVTGTAPQLLLRATDDRGRVASFTYRLDDGPAVTADAAHNTLSVPVGALPPGPHTLRVTAADPAGLVSAETLWPFTRQ